MSKPEFHDLGTLDAVETTSALDIGHLEDVVVTVTGTFDATVVVEISMDGTNWAPAPGSSSFQDVAGSYLIPGAAKQVRGSMTERTSGTARVMVGGRDLNRID